MASCSDDFMKWKRTCVTLTTNLAILDRLKKGESQSQLASEYGIGKFTVGNIKKNEAKIKTFATNNGQFRLDYEATQRMRLANDDELEQALFRCIVCAKTKPKPTCERSCIV